MPYKCPICGNEEEKYIGYNNGKPYCRACLSFRGLEASRELALFESDSMLDLSYSLSEEQKSISRKLLNNYKDKVNSLVHAVCGAGKTEIVLETIQYALEKGHNVGFTIPRRDVVIELAQRFQELFPKCKVTTLYGGNNSDLYGDIICLTTHQLFRYNQYFDLLILDEVDAFPYKGNKTLNSLLQRSIRGNYIILSATPNEKFVQKFKDDGGDVLELFVRFHHKPLPVPKIMLRVSIFKYFCLSKILGKFYKENYPCLVFVPTIDECEKLFKIIKVINKGGSFVHSLKKDRSKIIEEFRKGTYQYLITTSVLERGITIKNLQVIVFDADSFIFDSYALEQIAGRVGRKKDAPDGEVIFIAEEKNKEMEDAIERIKAANKVLQNMLSADKQ